MEVKSPLKILIKLSIPNNLLSPELFLHLYLSAFKLGNQNYTNLIEIPAKKSRIYV